MNDLLAILQERYPLAFPQDRNAIRPLKVGIREDIAAALGVDQEAVSTALRVWVSRLAYQQALSVYRVRIDLEGNAAGEVTELQQHGARTLAARIKEKAAARKKAAVAAAAVTPPPEPDPEPPRLRPVLTLSKKKGA